MSERNEVPEHYIEMADWIQETADALVAGIKAGQLQPRFVKTRNRTVEVGCEGVVNIVFTGERHLFVEWYDPDLDGRLKAAVEALREGDAA